MDGCHAGANGMGPASGSPGMHLGLGVAANAAACLSSGMQQVQSSSCLFGTIHPKPSHQSPYSTQHNGCICASL